MATCALFVDYENVVRSLRGQNINPTHKQLAELFRMEAAKWGELVFARAYAPWDIYPEAMSVFDRLDIKPNYVEGGRKDNADLVMSLEIQEFLRIPGRDADTFILVTGDGDFIHVIRILQQEKKRVVVWGVEGSISHRLVSRAGELVNIKEMLDRYGLLPAQNSGVAPSRPLNLDFSPTSDLASRALVVRAESVMLKRGWVQVPFLTLLEEMSTSALFGHDSEQRRLLVVKALEAGNVDTKKQPNPKRPGTDTTFVLLKKENPAVANTLKGVSCVIQHVRSLLAGMPGSTWVAYSLLDKELSADPFMPQGNAGAAERRAWIDLCVAEQLLRMERKENPKHPEHPTSVLYLAEEHPLVQQNIPGEDLTPMIRRLVIHMDHYLARTGYAWMSMGLLRRSLTTFGQKEMERSIRTAHESGILLIRQQPNQYGVRPTTGAYLNEEHPGVVESLALRDRVLDELIRLFGSSELVAAPAVMDRVAATAPETGLDAEEWIALLVNHQIISPASLNTGEPGYSLNRQHPVVSRRSPAITSP